MINWERTLGDAGIEYVSRGPNVKRGNVNIRCPWCGAADPSHHLGIDLESGKWGCWRNAEHRGKSPVRLLVAVLKRPVWEVRQMLGLFDAPDLSTFSGVRARLTGSPTDAPDAPYNASLEWPMWVRPINRDEALTGRFYEYIRDERGFGTSTGMVILTYQLKCALSGDQKGRVLFPYFYRGRMVTWTGRAITKSATLRYRDLEKDASVIFKNETLFNYDRAARGGRILIVVEGPIDAVKLDWGGRFFGVHAVGLSTNNISTAQMDMLAELASAYDRVYIGMDQPTAFARLDSTRMVSKLSGVIDAQALPRFPYKDFGEAPIEAIESFCKELPSEPLE